MADDPILADLKRSLEAPTEQSRMSDEELLQQLEALAEGHEQRMEAILEDYRQKRAALEAQIAARRAQEQVDANAAEIERIKAGLQNAA